MESLCLENDSSENKDYIAAEFNVPVSQPSQRKYGKSYSFEQATENKDCKCKSTAVICCTSTTDTNASSSLKQYCDDKELDIANLMMHFQDEGPELALTKISDVKEATKNEGCKYKSAAVTCCTVATNKISSLKQYYDDKETDVATLMMHFQGERQDLAPTNISDGQKFSKVPTATLPTEVTSSAKTTILEQKMSQIQTTNFNHKFDSMKTNESTLMRRFACKDEREMILSCSTFERQEMSNRSIETFAMDDVISIKGLDEFEDAMDELGRGLTNRRASFGKNKSGDSMQTSFSSFISSNRSVMSS